MDLAPVAALSPPADVAAAVEGRFPVVLIVSRLSALKGIPHVPPLVAALARRLPRVVVLIAGDGPERRPLEQAIRAAGLEDHVEFLGFREDVEALHGAADVYVSTSEFEGLVGYATLEAVLAGTPVVASAIPPVKEVLRDGVDALLVPPADAEGYARAVQMLAENPELQTAMTRSARERVRSTLDPARSARLLAQIYREILPRRVRA